MGCVSGCVCSGNCSNCSSYRKERYCGEAEDYADNNVSEYEASLNSYE